MFFAATFILLYGWFLVLWRMHQTDLPQDRDVFLRRPGGEPAAAAGAALAGPGGGAGDWRDQRRDDDGGVADVCAVLVGTGGRRGGSGVRETAELLSVHASGVAADRGMAAGDGGDRVRGGGGIPAGVGEQPGAGARARQHYRAAAMAWIVDCVCVFSADAGGAGVHQPVHDAAGRAHDFQRRELYRGARSDYREAGGGGGAGDWGGDRGHQFAEVAQGATAGGGGGAGGAWFIWRCRWWAGM